MLHLSRPLAQPSVYEHLVLSLSSSLFIAYFLIIINLIFTSSSTRTGSYPQRPSRQAVVAGDFPPPPLVRAFRFIAHKVRPYVHRL